jgi:hypothetical protein
MGSFIRTTKKTNGNKYKISSKKLPALVKNFGGSGGFFKNPRPPKA